MRYAISCVGLVCLACATTGPQPAPANASASAPANPSSTPTPEHANEPREVTRALGRARALATRARALRAPIYRGNGDADDSVAFLGKQLRPWLLKRRALQEVAAKAYDDAIRPRRAALVAYASAEVGELWADYVEEFVEAGYRAMPRSLRDQAGFPARYRATLVDAAAKQLAEARKLLQICVDTAGGAGAPDLGKRCAARIGRLPPPPTAAEAAPDPG